MSKAIPTIQKYMTTAPHSIGADQTLAHAHAVLCEYKNPHLPVLVGGKLVGMVTARALRFVESLRDVDPTKVTVKDAMVTNVARRGPRHGAPRPPQSSSAAPSASATRMRAMGRAGIGGV